VLRTPFCSACSRRTFRSIKTSGKECYYDEVTKKPTPKTILNSKYHVLWIGLNPKDLSQRIEKRLDKRLRQGMIKEVENLINHGVSHKKLENLGLEYRYVSRYLKSSISKKEMRDQLLREIIKYSKRQMTWFKRNKEIKWIT